MTRFDIASVEGELAFAPVTEVVTELGESPVWDDRRQALFWCDIPNGTIWTYAPAKEEVREIGIGARVGSLGLCESGRLIVAAERSILLVDPETGARRALLQVEEPFAGRLNDGRVGPDGAFWVGSVSDRALDDMPAIANLWRVTIGGASCVATGLKCSNGLAFSRDGRVMMHSDSVAQWVARHSFDPATGAIGPREVLCRPDEAAGRPDGAAMDCDGIYWSAGVSAGCLNGFDQAGVLRHRVAVPVPHPTMPCFGGADFRTLYLTSFRKGMSGAELAQAPLSGRLLAARVPCPGFAAPRFNDRGLA